MESRIVELLERTGPLTGAALHDALGGEAFVIWRTCRLSPLLACRRVGRRYLRFDRRVDGYARLSPSILREFLTYTVIGLTGDPASLERQAEELQAHVREVSRRKLELATRILTDVAHQVRDDASSENRFCALLAGDIVYEMAHEVPRPERSTGAMVCGSDLDVVVLVADEAPGEFIDRLDREIYRQKGNYLRNPAFREEIDYVVKRFARLVEQARFDTFPHMVACKILDEAVLLCGSPGLFTDGRALLAERGVIDRLRRLERAAVQSRYQLEEHFLATGEGALPREDAAGFYTDDEAEEFQ